MLNTQTFTLAAPTKHLQQLNIIRSVLLFIFWASIIVNVFISYAEVDYLLFVVAGLTLINGLTFIRLKNALAVTEIEFFMQLLIDAIALNTLFYLSGGATNPFISYLLVPICIAAATLPWRLTCLLTLLNLISYTLLLFFYIEFPLFAIHHQHGNSNINWHILGMWFNFFISAMLISYYIVKMAAILREQQDSLSRLREDDLRNEQLLAVAMLAAGAAHEINTPLSTMKVLLSELRNDYQDNSQLLPDLQLLSQQVDICAGTLKQLVQDSSSATQGNFKTQSIRQYCDSVVDRWQLMRPYISFTLNYVGENFEDNIAFDPRLDQAIINILNNAADASHDNIQITLKCIDTFLEWIITDHGSGFQSTHLEHIGQKIFSTKNNGLGLGMVITQATLNRCGGTLTQSPNLPTGTITTIRIPVHI